MRSRSFRSVFTVWAATILAILALLMLTACFPLESILIDDSTTAPQDTVVVHDTTLVWCRHHDPRPECRK